MTAPCSQAILFSEKDDAMTKIMTPSVQMTDGQIDKAVGLYRAMLQKHRSELSSEPVQQILGQPEFVGEMVGVLRKRVEVISSLTIRHAKVDGTRSPQKALDATGRKQYTDKDVVKAMPKGESGEVEICFFKLGRYVSDDDLEREYDLHGLKPADPYSLAAVNEADPAFADTQPNCTHWKDSNGKWCYAAFDQWYDGGRRVFVSRRGHVWNDYWWFAGVRK